MYHFFECQIPIPTSLLNIPIEMSHRHFGPIMFKTELSIFLPTLFVSFSIYPHLSKQNCHLLICHSQKPSNCSSFFPSNIDAIYWHILLSLPLKQIFLNTPLSLAPEAWCKPPPSFRLLNKVFYSSLHFSFVRPFSSLTFPWRDYSTLGRLIAFPQWWVFPEETGRDWRTCPESQREGAKDIKSQVPSLWQ